METAATPESNLSDTDFWWESQRIPTPQALAARRGSHGTPLWRSLDGISERFGFFGPDLVRALADFLERRFGLEVNRQFLADTLDLERQRALKGAERFGLGSSVADLVGCYEKMFVQPVGEKLVHVLAFDARLQPKEQFVDEPVCSA